jgi:uncharacterized protein (TIGR02246 family)
MSSDEQAIRDLIAAWHRATAAGDVARVLTFMSEDVVFLVVGHPPMRGRQTFEAGLRSVLATHRIESAGDVQEVEVSGDLAFSWTHLSVTMTPLDGGAPMRRMGHALTILRKGADGVWRVVRDANLLAPEPV